MSAAAASVRSARPIPWRWLVREALAAALPRRLYLTHGPADNTVCLTFDDGPHPEYTPAFLDVLKQQGVPATFFVVGQRAERHPELVRRLAAEGHALGHHTYAHGNPAATSARQLLEEVRRTREVLAGLLGEAPNLFRPPHGRLTPAKLWRLWRARQTVVLWNVDTRDFARPSADEFRGRFRARPLRGGDIVLMHDDRPYALTGLAEVIAEARGRGLRFGTVSRWLGG